MINPGKTQREIAQNMNFTQEITCQQVTIQTSYQVNVTYGGQFVASCRKVSLKPTSCFIPSLLASSTNS